MRIGAVVVTYNSEGEITALLDSIPDAMGDLQWSVVVVDNGSTDRTLELLSDRTDCTVIRSTNVGYAASINRAVAASPTADAILMLNPDVILDPQSVEAMAGCLLRSGVGIVAPRVREHDGTLSPTLRRGPTILRASGLSFTGLPVFTERVEEPQDYETEHRVDWAVGAILLISSRCFRDLSGMDESFFLYSEETDLCLRAADVGWATWYTPLGGAVHIGGGSGVTVTNHTMKIINRVRLYRRRRSTPLTIVYFLLVLLTEVRRGLLGHRWSRAAALALIQPSRRPPALHADTLIPR
ncbi:glycosyltransferase [Calidifontibacter indicus]|uniref:glycosyltransferase n=1 Tax=Calidifontibacter indicus TaxID=419650 RepID=UPI003D71639F